ncbi:MAG: hypothetical protein GX075_02350 [Firmicutes bacterium]|nr:hypothetical protein [Bacillota bacterium]
MKKNLALICNLLLFLTLGHPTIAGVIPIEVTKGVSVSFEKYLEPSDSEQATFTGNFGLNDHLLLKCGYITEVQRNIIGGRYAFNEKMAVMFDHEWKDEDSSNKYGFAYKFNFKDRLGLVGLVEYQSQDIALTGQAEYGFNEAITAYGGFKYAKPDQGDAAIDLLLGAEFKPIAIFSFYFDYLMPEEGDETVYFGLTYTF